VQVLDPVSGRIVNLPDQATLPGYQATRATAIGNELIGSLPTYANQEQQAYAGLQGLNRNLQAVIAGTAPSVAQTQLAEGAGQIQQQAASQAGSVAGPNSAMAGYLAMIQSAQARAKANQDAAALRAQEVAQARQAQATTLGQSGSLGANMYNSTLGGAVNLAGTGTTAAGQKQAADTERDKANKALVGNIITGLGSAATTAALA